MKRACLFGKTILIHIFILSETKILIVLLKFISAISRLRDFISARLTTVKEFISIGSFLEHSKGIVVTTGLVRTLFQFGLNIYLLVGGV